MAFVQVPPSDTGWATALLRSCSTPLSCLAFLLLRILGYLRTGAVEGTELRLTTASVLIALTLNAALLFLYGFLLEAAWGATLGKAMIGIKVEGTSRSRSFA